MPHISLIMLFQRETVQSSLHFPLRNYSIRADHLTIISDKRRGNL